MGQHPSEQAKAFGKLLGSEEVEFKFLDSVLSKLHELEYKSRRNQISKDDINFVSECLIADMKTNKHSNRPLQRVDGYFYTYGKLQHYCRTYKAFPDSLKKLQKEFVSFLQPVFDDTKGQQPNLLIKDKALITDMNRNQFLAFGVIIDSIDTLKKFLIICKFVLQADMRINDDGSTRRWVDIMSNVKHIDISLVEFINTYLNHVEGFKKFPFDMSMLAHLIQRLHPPKTQESSLALFHLCSLKLSIKTSVFLEHLKPIFGEGVRNGSYAFEHVARFFRWMKSASNILLQYLSEYANNATKDDLWDMFLHLYEVIEMNETVRHHLKDNIREKILSVSIRIFHRYVRAAKNSLGEIPERSKKHFAETFENIFDNYMNEKIGFPYHWNQVTRTDCKDLLEIGLELSQSNRLERDSLLFLVRKIIFAVDSIHQNRTQKLIDIFRNLKMIDEKWCHKYLAEKIIPDDWLSDFLITHIDIWLNIDRKTYDDLISNYQRHPWSGHIWSRICHLSFSKMTGNKSIETLSKMNRWIQAVQHHIYSPTDNFTIIFIIKVFDLVLERCLTSVLLLPNISNLINYIIAMKQDPSARQYQNRIETFLKSTTGYVEELIRLNGKLMSNREG